MSKGLSERFLLEIMCFFKSKHHLVNDHKAHDFPSITLVFLKTKTGQISKPGLMASKF